MRLRWTSHFARAYGKAPEEIRAAFDQQSLFLLRNLRHPSLRARKYNEGSDRWQARVTKNWLLVSYQRRHLHPTGLPQLA
jgi:hypothetical protein